MLKNSVLNEGSNMGFQGNQQQQDEQWYQGGAAGRETPTQHFYEGGTSMMTTGADGDEDDDDELPLLEELGVRPDQIIVKLKCVLNPTKKVDKHVLDDADLAGPIIFCLCLGTTLLFTGHLRLGYVYGFGVIGATAMNILLNLLHSSGLSFSLTASVLGYSMLPVIILAALSIFLRMKGLLGILLSTVAIAWSTFSALRLLDAKLQLGETFWLVAYPTALLYSTFTLISVL